MAIKISLKKLQISPDSFKQFMYQQMTDNGLIQLSIEHLHKVTHLEFHHRDPFDRLLIAQSLVEELPIIGKDAVFDSYGIQRIW